MKKNKKLGEALLNLVSSYLTSIDFTTVDNYTIYSGDIDITRIVLTFKGSIKIEYKILELSTFNESLINILKEHKLLDDSFLVKTISISVGEYELIDYNLSTYIVDKGKTQYKNVKQYEKIKQRWEFGF